MKRTAWSLAALFLPISLHGAPTAVTLSGKKLLVGGQSFSIQGVAYSPTPVGQTPGQPGPNCGGPYLWWADRSAYVADFPLIQSLGANTLRTYSVMNASANTAQVLQALDAAQSRHLYVVMGYFVQTFYNLADPAIQSQISTEVLNAVDAYKNHPAVLMWAIGNEVNLNNGNQNAAWYAFLNSLAGQIKARDPNHPVTTVQGECPQCAPAIDYQIGSSALGTTDAAMPNLDFWSVTSYRGTSFQGLFQTLASSTTKPIFLAEFGKDAYHDAIGAEDQAMQASYISSQWKEISSHLSVSAGGNLVGASVFEWTDEWWKDPNATSCFVHGTAVLFTRSGDSIDPNYNEEWFGLSAISPIDALTNPDGASRRLRQSYFTLQAVWNPAAAKPVGGAAQGLFQATVHNFPNPFRLGVDGTQFVALTRVAAALTIDIYDAGGQHVTRLTTSSPAPGRMELHWDGRNRQGEQVSAGLYFARIEGRGGGLDEIQFRKVVAVR